MINDNQFINSASDSPISSLRQTSVADSVCTIGHLSVEHYYGDVLGVSTAQPRLSWMYSAPIPDDAQVLLTVTRRVPGKQSQTEHVYVPGNTSSLVTWPFSPLVSRESVTVYAQVMSASQNPLSAPSEPLHFEVGLLAEHEFVADFVGPSWVEAQTDHRHLPLVRTQVQLDDAPVRARLYLSALGVVEAYVNGMRVGNDALTPGWTNYNSRLNVWTYDITSHMRAGDNGFGFWLGDGWYRGRIGFDGGYANYYGDRIGVFAQIEVEYANGVTQSWYSNSWDRQWKAALGPIVCSDLCEGEHYDARLEQSGFSEAGFDDSEWQPVAEVYYNPAKLANPTMNPVQPYEEHTPVHITCVKREADGRGSWLIDFGQNCTQRITLRMRDLQVGERVIVRHGEVLEPDGSIATRTLRRGQQCDIYTSNGNNAWWEPKFAMHGFRYAQIDGYRGELTAEDMHCRVYHSVMERTGDLTTSHALLNRLHSNAVWSMRSNFVSLPTDCPQRDERLGWTGDICLFAPTAAYLYDVQAFLSSWLIDMREDQRTWGTIPFYVPFVPLGVWAHPQAIAIWGDAAVNVPWTLYSASGDEQILSQNYELSRTWVDEVASYLSEDGVWDRRPPYALGQLGDWLDPSAPPEDPTQAVTEKELVATAFFARSCTQIVEICHILHRQEDEVRYRVLRDHVIQGFLNRFVRSDGTMTSDTQCAYALAIAFGLLDGDPEHKMQAGNRLAQLVRESEGKISTGFAGTPFVLPALSDTDHYAEALELLESTACPSWLYQVVMGGTTTWERWDSMRPDGSLNPGGMTSFNHYALGSVAEWMHAHIGGLQSLEPGWKRFKVAPYVQGDITSARTEHLTPYGRAVAQWNVDAATGRLNLQVTVPVGTTAVVDLMNHDPIELTAGEHSIDL